MIYKTFTKVILSNCCNLKITSVSLLPAALAALLDSMPHKAVPI